MKQSKREALPSGKFVSVRAVAVLFVALLGILMVPACTYSGSENLVVESGEPRAQIIISEEPERLVRLAAEELRDYVKKISGAELPVRTVLDESYPTSIYLGRSQYTDDLGITDEGPGHGAFRIISGPDYVVLLGHDLDYQPPELAPQKLRDPNIVERWDEATRDYTDSYWGYPLFSLWRQYNDETGTWFHDQSGSLNAVYALLRHWGVRWYFPGEVGEVVPEQTSLSVPELDEVVRPDFKVRRFFGPAYFVMSRDDLLWIRRLGLNYGYPVLGSTGHVHGLRRLHGREELQEMHPEYYALIGGERMLRGRGHVCFNSEGFTQETIQYVRAVFDLLDEPTVDLWPEDGFRMCECEKCAGLSPAEVVFPFVKRVAEEVYTTHPDRLITCGAYSSFRLPPDNLDEFPPNVAVTVAFQRPGLDEPESWGAMYGGVSYEDLIGGWSAKVEKGNILGNSNHRGHGVLMTRSIARDLRARRGRSLGDWNETGHMRGGDVRAGRETGRQTFVLGIHHLNLYVNARLLWDAEQDLDALLDEYYEKFYGPVADQMKEALEMAESGYTRGEGRASLPTETRIAVTELMESAREEAGDTVYGQRIAYILEEEPSLESLLQRLREQQEAEAARLEAPLAVAAPSGELPETYELVDLQTGETPDERTTFTVEWHDGDLIFDIRCEESDMENLMISRNIWSGDSIAVLLETPTHAYYQIEVNPDGDLWDADREYGVINDKWSSLAEVETERGEDFWRVRIRIPVMDDAAGGLDPLHNVVGEKPTPENPWFFQVGRARFRDFEKIGAYGFTATGGSYHVRGRFGRLVVGEE